MPPNLLVGPNGQPLPIGFDQMNIKNYYGQQAVPIVTTEQTYVVEPVFSGVGGAERTYSTRQYQTQTQRSSSIPPGHQRQYVIDDSSSIINNRNGAASAQFFSTNSNQSRQNYSDQQYYDQQMMMNDSFNNRTLSTPRNPGNIGGTVEMRSSEQYHSNTIPAKTSAFQQNIKSNRTSSSTTNTAAQSSTLPMNGHNNNNNMMSSSTSCIDYSNTHYNSDWAMRHGCIGEKPTVSSHSQVISNNNNYNGAGTPSIITHASTPTMIPIYQQQLSTPTPTPTQQLNNNNNNTNTINQMKVR